MEVGGLMAQVFKTVLGNPDVMAVILIWSVFVSLLFSAINIYQFIKG